MIPSRCFEIATNKGEIVMDPFGGGGSSYQAAQGLKRYWLGSELTDCAPILDRFRHYFPDHMGKKPFEKLFSVFR